jgi:23S rRNA (uracil1939-C5)-methyltransferase
MKMEFEVSMQAMVYGGNAMGKLEDGRAVFVPFALPGELVRIRLTEEKPRYCRGELIEILKPSLDRIQPRCRHFGACGGCHYQHLSYEKQLEVKTAVVVEQLERLAGLENPPVKPIVASPNAWNYRNAVQFHLSPTGKMAFQRVSSHELVEVDECFLPEIGLDEVWRKVEIDPQSRLERVEFRQGSDGEILLNLEGDDEVPPEMETDLPISMVYLGSEKPYVMSGEESVVMEVKNRLFRCSAGSFFQVNLPQAENLVHHVFQKFDLKGDETLLDIYCGVGLFSAFAAPKVSRCIGIELSPWAVNDFVANLDEFDNVEIYQAAVEDVLPQLPVEPEAVIIDPPRSGLHPRVVDALLDKKPEKIVYVSCDPATLARDVRRLLEGGYRLEEIQPFDMFPQTYHVETVCFLKRTEK